MSGFPYGEVLNLFGGPSEASISGKNKPVLRFIALLLVMDSDFPTLLSLAQQGQPLAIATLINQSIDSDEIDVTAWKKQGLLHVDLMSFERLSKAEMLPIIRQTLAMTDPKGIRAIKLSSYIYGEDLPCWMERMGAGADLVMEATDSSLDLRSSWSNHLAEAIQGLLLGSHRRRWATGAIAAIALATAALGISLNSNSPVPSFADQTEDRRPIKARSQTSRIQAADPSESNPSTTRQEPSGQQTP